MTTTKSELKVILIDVRCFFFLLLFTGRRPRIGATAKGQLKVSAAIGKKDCTKPLRKMATNGVNDLETITQRTRNLRKSLHKIQKQFDNQAITKFFQRTLKAHSYPGFGDEDENACDSFTTDELTNLSDSGDGDGGGGKGANNNELTKSDDDDKEFSTSNANANDENISIDGDMKMNDDALNLCLNNDEHTDQNSNGNGNITSNSIQPTNIFLQKPVLHLNIDKSQVQAASIVINKHLDACPNFATSFNAFNNSVLNTANNKIQSKSSEDESSAEQNDMQSPNDLNAKDQKTKYEKPRLRKRRPRKCASRWAIDNAHIDAINDSDSNSCDSGVVSDRSFELSSTDGNKPTTPHRILCPSTSTPTHDDSPKILPQPNLNRVNAIKRPTVKRTRGKITQKM